MASTRVDEKTKVMTTEGATKVPQLSDIIDIVLSNAADFAASKLGVDNQDAVYSQVRQGNGNACSYFSYALAKQVGEQIAALDQSVKAVYYFEHDATPEDTCFSEAKPRLAVQLIVWAARKTAALTAMGDSFDRGLREKLMRQIDGSTPGHILDLLVADDQDIETRSGYGALVAGLHQRPIEVWKR